MERPQIRVHPEAIALARLQVVVRAAGDDDLHVVAARGEVVDHHPRAHRVPHPLAHDAVEDARHAGQCTARGCRARDAGGARG